MEPMSLEPGTETHSVIKSFLLNNLWKLLTQSPGFWIETPALPLPSCDLGELCLILPIQKMGGLFQVWNESCESELTHMAQCPAH